MTDADVLATIVKAYDVRGLVDGQLTPDVVRALGAAFLDEVGASAPVVIGHDMRPSSPELAAAAAEGVVARGGDVVRIGLCSTDESYFASGSLDAPAIMFTASHNPAAYNGMKLSRAGAQAMSLDTGLAAIRDRAAGYLASGIPDAVERGTVVDRDVLADYASLLRSLVDLSRSRPLKVVVDAANGMGGLTVPAVLGTAAGLPALPIEVVPMYFELDGTFPNHEANPLEPKNLVDLQAAVVQHDADLGLAFDGDADRCFVVDEHGAAVSPSAISAIVALREVRRVQAEGETDVVVLHNLISSRIVPETIVAAGATPVRTRVGHSLIKAEMARTNAVFGGEHSAHYYFRDFFGADNGMLAALHVLAQLGASDEPMSSLAARFTPYHASGEINSTVHDVPAAYARIVEAFAHDGVLDDLDGLFLTAHDGSWWLSVRPSNTEPLLRLNVEAEDAGTMERIRDAALAIIRA
ncbi:phosphomannomutase/phosphoglucomutase [Agrococcus sp. SGAir0287]|uniref:phosphomannomutase/phosphoglucomutase n=1 Tax=Agrococcus sp. SGAir0287 TaxID=2070347 RepID=UPI0010CD28AD|nr:phosphomannomutase/phosphoglucomutase [Agrococcus sp. SGAir0287]QCR18686.1 phosphomannomutase/phosphoglucomutase [Agrococcus sp. SGAir0287]